MSQDNHRSGDRDAAEGAHAEAGYGRIGDSQARTRREDDARTRRKPTTVPQIRARKGETPLVMVTAYDATFARMLDEAGVDILLVGDSLGMVVHGRADTLGVTVDDIVYHCKAVARGNRFAHVVGDMPFLSYQVTPEDALRNAGRIVAEGHAHAVKLEGGEVVAPAIAKITAAGIPVRQNRTPK